MNVIREILMLMVLIRSSETESYLEHVYQMVERRSIFSFHSSLQKRRGIIPSPSSFQKSRGTSGVDKERQNIRKTCSGRSGTTPLQIQSYAISHSPSIPTLAAAEEPGSEYSGSEKREEKSFFGPICLPCRRLYLPVPSISSTFPSKKSHRFLLGWQGNSSLLLPVMAYAQGQDVAAGTRFHNTQPKEEVLDVWRKADAVCFDVDSTVCLDDGIDELADYCGGGKAVAEWTARFFFLLFVGIYKSGAVWEFSLPVAGIARAMNGSVSLEEALSARLSLFKPSLTLVHDFLDKRPPRLSPGIADLVKTLQARKTDVYLVSGGLRQLIQPIALQLGIPPENIFANQLLFESSGELGGFDMNEPTSRNGGKAAHGYNVMVMIGDGTTDLERPGNARKPGGADMFICYAGVQLRESVAAKADWLVFQFQDLMTSLQ
ncbi:hypothetical protein ACLOJK_035586 [Asimina triloba]